MRQDTVRITLKRWGLYVRTLIKWALIATAIGMICGVIGTAFHVGVHEVTTYREANRWVIWLLPLGGLGIVGFYRLTKTDGLGTNDVIEAVHKGKQLPFWLLPAIFLSTVVTHLLGGSAG